MFKEISVLKKNLQNGSNIKKNLSSHIILGLILFLGIALRFYDLGAESYWIDEMSTVVEGQQSIQQLLSSGRLDQPPAYYIPFHFWVQFFGTSEVGTRTFSVLIGVSSIIVIYILGRELFGDAIGLLSAFFMAISEYQINYSQVARFYGFFELAALFSFLFFVLALRNKKYVYFVLYGVTSLIMVYSHTHGLFILAAQNLYIFMQIKKFRNLITTWLICQVLIVLAFIPYFYPLLFSEGSLEKTVQSNVGSSLPSIVEPFRSVYHFILPARRERSSGIILANYALAGALFIVGIWIHAIKLGKNEIIAAGKKAVFSLWGGQEVKSKILLLSCWLICPILLPFILSFIVMPLYKHYYTISAAPALYLLLALGIFNIRKVVPLIISLSVLLVMIVPSLSYYYDTSIHEQWREAATYVSDNSGPDEVIVFAPDMGIGIQQKSFNWYYKGNSQSCGLGVELVENPVSISDGLMQCTAGYERFWVVIPEYSNVTSDDRFRNFFLNPDQTIMSMLDEQHFVRISVYLFELEK